MGLNNTAISRLLPSSALKAGLAICLFAVIQSSNAREPLYGALDNEDLLRCEVLFWHGQLTPASFCYRDLYSVNHPPEIRAEAMWAMGDIQTANSLFQSAVESSPENSDIRLRWGDLYMQTYQFQEAYNLFQEALELNPENAYAHIGAASALAQGGGGEEVNQHIAAVMENFAAPAGAKLQIMMTSVQSALEKDRYDTAREALEEAKKLAENENLSTLELLALEASLAFMTREDYQPFIDAALEQNPRYGNVYAILGYFASITRLYTESGEFYDKAVEIEPAHWQAHLELGQNHLRQNRVTKAIQHVEISYDGDPFNPKTVNMLRLLETFIDNFELLNYPDPPEVGQLPALTLRLHKDERDIIKDYAQALSEDSMATFSERYRHNPVDTITVEIYPNHEDFVVRSIGMPGVGILGVTFGNLFAMDSPSGHPEESYHWGTTLWHEMAHVFTLGVTNNRVPRWYSEGVSVYEEWNTGPIPGVKIPTEVLQAMAEGKFLSIAELDDGFMRPTYDGQVIVSYMQSGLVFQFINQEFGHDKIVDILYQFNDGISPVDAIESTLEISVKDFDLHFKQYIDIEYGPLLSNLNVWIEDYRASFQALQHEDWAEAVAAADRAIFTYPDYVEIDSPYIAKARAYSKLEEKELEFEALETFWEKGGYAPRALMALADVYIEKNSHDKAVAVLTDINYADPFNEELHNKLGDLFLEMGQAPKALDEYMVSLALNPIDKAAANYRIANAYNKMNEPEQSMDYLMTALDIAPQYRPAQMLLLEMSRATLQN